jgi:hypothetical protein
MKTLHKAIVVLVLLAVLAGPAVAGRIVAMGDLHGDLDATRQALRLAGAIDDSDHWIGGTLTVVQTGDQLDRGDQEKAILELLDRLQDEARAAGGALHILNGNHELMNARPDLRYVTEGGFADFEGAVPIAEEDSLLLAHEPSQRSRVAAFRPGAPYAVMLAERPVVLVLDGNVFVHGGVLPMHLDYGLDRLNDEVRDWLLGLGEPPEFIHTGNSPTWTRDYSDEVEAEDCQQLAEVLERLGAKMAGCGASMRAWPNTTAAGSRCWRSTEMKSVFCVRTRSIEGNRASGLEILQLPGPVENDPDSEVFPLLGIRAVGQEPLTIGREGTTAEDVLPQFENFYGSPDLESISSLHRDSHHPIVILEVEGLSIGRPLRPVASGNRYADRLAFAFEGTDIDVPVAG